MADRVSIGVDRSNGAWLEVVYQNGEYTDVAVTESITELCEAYDESPERVLVDMPIGLFEDGDREGDEKLTRECDKKARTILGSRHSSVFNPPARDVVRNIVESKEGEQDESDGATYEAVKEKNKEITGKGLQKQAYYIAEGIYELDCLLRNDRREGDDECASVIMEAHPEVCFTALADSQLQHSKSSVAGLVERLTAMENVQQNPSEVFFEVCSDIESKTEREVDIDDVLDATVLALTATSPQGELQQLPCNEPPTDSRNLPMKMVYRSKHPFPEVTEDCG